MTKEAQTLQPRWTVFETSFESAKAYDNPFWNVDLQVRFTSPTGTSKTVDAFWDGDRTWRVRFAPDEVGAWQWVTHGGDADDEGLYEQAGVFTCTPYGGDNRLYRRGPVQLSANRRHFIWADGEPFFWLADTAWNGVLRAKGDDWAEYLAARRDQAFDVIQFVSTEWRGAREVLGDERAYTGTEHIRVNPEFFRRRDRKVAAINEHGLIAAPVILWAVGPTDPGQALPEEDAVRLARYIVARWDAYHVVWFLGGDGDYRDERAERWHRIGNAVFDDDRGHDRLVTMHPGGQMWVGEEFREQPWYDFIGYQSGHGSSEEHLRWLVVGPPSTHWSKEPPLPVVNLEPNYERHPSYHINRKFTDYEVRRAAYWSLLVSPTAGVSFGVNPIWVWADEPQVPEGHDRIGVVAPWRAGVETPGVQSMAVICELLGELDWWNLRPAPQVLYEQPGKKDPRHFIAAAQSEDRETTVIYTPLGGTLTLDVDELPPSPVVCWFDSQTGDWDEFCALPDATGVVETPGPGDWVLLIKSGRSGGDIR